MLATAVCSTGTAGAATGPTVKLGSGGFGRLVVDGAHAHVLVSRPDTNEVLVLDDAGQKVAIIKKEYGAAGMVVVGDVIYIVQSTTGRVDRIDAATFAKLGVLARGLDHVNEIAYTGGQLWVTVGGSQDGSLASISPSTGKVTVFPLRIYETDIATSPGDAATLFVAEDGLSPGDITRYDVSSRSPVSVAKTPFDAGSNFQDLTVSGDGKRVLPAHGAPYEFDEFRASNLTPDGLVYPGHPYPNAVASTPGDPQRLATGEESASTDSVQVFKYGKPAAIFGANPRGEVVPHGLAFTPTGDTLFVVSSSAIGGGGSYTLTIYPLP